MRAWLAIGLISVSLIWEARAMAQSQDWWLFHREQGCVRPPLVEGERFLPETVIRHFPKCFIDTTDTYGKGPWTFVNCFQEQKVGLGFFYFRKQQECRAFASRAEELMRRRQ
ncbi:MAG: hypothetical protein F9K44_12085 [Hyphomicrobiaceae bacterium]|nr:MAG: hypothetical protein F9K44_12085 [Hyphomicrobiaceae bacterium]